MHQFSQTSFFTRESSYCFQRVLAIAILSVRPSVTRVDQSKAVQARINISSPSAAWKTLVSKTVKLFHKFERSVKLYGRGRQSLGCRHGGCQNSYCRNRVGLGLLYPFACQPKDAY